MTIRVYMDHHIDAAITRGLRQRGVDVITAFEDGTSELDDEPLLLRATELGCLLFSQDHHLLEIANRWLRIGQEFGGVAYGHKLEISIGQAVRDLEIIAKVYDQDEVRNRIEYLPL